MIFDSLYESSQRGELILVDGGMCHWHLRRDGQLTIREIISTKKGAGWLMLERLKSHPGAKSLFAKCPADLDANGWYHRRGFVLEGTETTRSGKLLNLWRLALDHTPTDDFTFVIVRGGDGVLTPEVVRRTGVAYGLREDYASYMQPVYMVDFDWRRAVTPARWRRYLDILRDLKPYAAMVPDYESPAQYRQLMNQIADVRPLVKEVMVCPKFEHAPSHIPRDIRMAISVPSEHAGYLPKPEELAGRKLHLLGGHIDQWLYLKSYYNDAQIVSGDTATPIHQAHAFGKYWSHGQRGYVEMRNEFFDTEALAITSVRNMLSAWSAGEVIWSNRVADMVNEWCLPMVAGRLIS